MQKTRRDFLKRVGIVAMGFSGTTVALPGLVPVTEAMPDSKGKIKPNIILFLTDDQGWTDTSVQMMAGRADSKSDFYQTPALARMAKEGMVFSSAYSPAPVFFPVLILRPRYARLLVSVFNSARHRRVFGTRATTGAPERTSITRSQLPRRLRLRTQVMSPLTLASGVARQLLPSRQVTIAVTAKQIIIMAIGAL